MKPNWRNEVDPELYQKAQAECKHQLYSPCDACLKRVLLEAEAPPWESKWLVFIESRDTGKTKVWSVSNRQGGGFLGEVKWYGGFRSYAFYPVPGTLYDAACLADVAHFMQLRMNERKVARG